MTSDFKTVSGVVVGFLDIFLSIEILSEKRTSVVVPKKYFFKGSCLDRFEWTPFIANVAHYSTTSTASSHREKLARGACISPGASPAPMSRGGNKNCELSAVEGRTALGLWYAWAFTPGKERILAAVGPRLAARFGVEERYSRKIWASKREGTNGQGATRISKAITTTCTAVRLHPRKICQDSMVITDNRTVTSEKNSSKLAEVGRAIGSSKLHNWLRVMGNTVFSSAHQAFLLTTRR